MAKLTKRLVDALKPAEADTFVWDGQVPGFGVRVKRSGRKTFIVQYRTMGGRSRRLTIGSTEVFSVEQAREEAKEHLRAARKGEDPAAQKRFHRAAPTVADLATRYLESHARTKKRPSSVRTDESNLRNHVLPRLGSMKVVEVRHDDVARLHHDMAGTPGAANRVVALLSKMFSLAERWALRPPGTNPCAHIDKYPERKFERFLSEDELARLAAVLSRREQLRVESPSAVGAIRLLLFTGARLTEILTLKWSYVDLTLGLLFLPDSKTGRKTIPINAPAREVLEALRTIRRDEWVMPGSSPGRHLVNLRKPWHRIRSEAGLDDVRIHDLRHSFASAGIAGGISLPVIGGLLGHTQPQTTARYAHLAADPLREASNRIGARLVAAMRPPQSIPGRLRS